MVYSWQSWPDFDPKLKNQATLKKSMQELNIIGILLFQNMGNENCAIDFECLLLTSLESIIIKVNFIFGIDNETPIRKPIF